MKILYKILFPPRDRVPRAGGVHGPGGAWREVDVCVYGGTAAGVMAAYTAAMEGKSVLLVEPGRHLGGMTSGGLGYTDIGNKYVVTGLARDFYRRLGSHYGKLEQWVFEPSVAERTLNGYVERAGVEVLYDYRLHGVQMRDGASAPSSWSIRPPRRRPPTARCAPACSSTAPTRATSWRRRA